MGRYTYNSSKVSQAIDELNDALGLLTNVTPEMQAGITAINSARGSHCLDIDYSKLLQLQTMAEEVVEEDIRTIQQKVTIIEDYENAPLYKKLFTSIGMGFSKIIEGVASGVENITDGAVSIAGFVGGIFNSEFKNSVAEYVAKDHVGNWFNEQYDEGFLSGISKYSLYSEESTFANIFKGFGTALPYVTLSMTGVGTVTEVTAAALGGIGSGTEAGINKALMNNSNLKAGDVFNKAFSQGVWQGAKNAALVYGMNKLAQGIHVSAANKSGVVSGLGDDFAKLTSGNMDDVAAYAKDLFKTTDDLVAKTVNGRVQLYNSKTLEVVGDVVSDGSKAVLRTFGNATDDVATIVISKNGEALGYGMLKNTDDILATSFDDLAKSSSLTKTERLFSNAKSNMDSTKVGQAVSKGLNASDDALKAVGTKTGNLIKKVPGASTVSTKASKILNGIKSNKIVKGVSTTIANTVKAHPGAAYATAATVFALDQVDEDVINSAYRQQQEQVGDIKVRPTPTLTTSPIPSLTITPTPPILTPTPTASGGGYVSSPTPMPTSTSIGGGGGYTPNSTSTVAPTIIPTSGPTATEVPITTQVPTVSSPPITTPAPTVSSTPMPTTTTYSPAPTYARPSYNQTPTTGGGGYTEDGYIGEEYTGEGTQGEFDIPESEEMTGSITEIVGGNEYTNIPTSAAPITTTTTKGTKKSIIPVIAGLGAAAVAGIGTKAYLDKKEENSSEEDFDAEEWTEEDSLDIDYNEAMEEDRDYLNPSDEYAYQEESYIEGEETSGSYEAVNSSELASMQ